MSLPDVLKSRLKVPLVMAPMFLISTPKMVISACKAGILGTFPALNQRSSEGFEDWVKEVSSALSEDDAPYGVNLVVHRTNERLQADLDICIKYKVPVVITSLGINEDVIQEIHAYGGIVFHDVIQLHHAHKAVKGGVDGLIAVCAGAGGHAGTLNPFVFMNEIRSFYDGTVLLAGGLSTGKDIVNAQRLGADLAYMGTRFIATEESGAQNDYKQMVVEANSMDIVYTSSISGVYANFLRQSLEEAGLDVEELKNCHPDSSRLKDLSHETKAWKDIWSAGQGVSHIHDIPSVEKLVQRLKLEML